MLQAGDLFEFPQELPFSEYFSADAAPWEWIPRIKEALDTFDFSGGAKSASPALYIGEQVFIDPTVKLPLFGSIEGPAYIGPECELRPGVFVRANVIAGRGCVLGNSCEFKNALLLNGVQVPHFSYVGDSILGNGAHLGAGVICSNLRLDQANVMVTDPEDGKVDSGLRKLGAIIGDRAEVGCNAVLNPGTILGRGALVMPTLSFRGTLGDGKIAR